MILSLLLVVTGLQLAGGPTDEPLGTFRGQLEASHLKGDAALF